MIATEFGKVFEDVLKLATAYGYDVNVIKHGDVEINVNRRLDPNSLGHAGSPSERALLHAAMADMQSAGT